ncbi:MAG: GNAT family N-acetyltransferase [Treponema sp.]|jgi:Leu/Phe-tRNA-protein transferase|nr:GNAT family N-acetyltransferase [Treponema sp.]
MNRRFLRYTPSGHIFISPKDNLDRVVDAMVDTNYREEFCIAVDFDPAFIANLMAAGFLVMSTALEEGRGDEKHAPTYILLPKLHLIRSVLFFPALHVKKSLRRQLSQYELKVDTDFDRILDRCAEVHGDEWLTSPLRQCFKVLHLHKGGTVRPISFGVYRNGELKAGEFGMAAGRVYTSYSGYYDEDSAGTVQMVLMTYYLRDAGFVFLDLGMPLDYKDQLGAQNIDPQRFVAIFRQGRSGTW